MGIIEDIQAASMETLAEFTQDQWASALIKSWRNFEILASACKRAAHVCKTRNVTINQLGEMLEHARSLRPVPPARWNFRMPVRAFIDQYAHEASELLFREAATDSEIKAALLKGSVHFKAKTTPAEHTRRKRVDATDARTKVVFARSLTKNHDWNTCK